MGEMWRRTQEQDRQKYVDLSNADKERYRRECEKVEEAIRAIQEGRSPSLLGGAAAETANEQAAAAAPEAYAAPAPAVT